MATPLKSLIPGRYHWVFDSLMPGGANWHESDDDCLTVCPFFEKCRGNGPGDKLCSDEWGDTAATVKVLMVLKHIFEHFDFYNRGDIDRIGAEKVVSEIVEILDFPFDARQSATEALAIVKIRLKQTEFKANLFDFWKGCSLAGMAMNPKYLIASHIKPWSNSDDQERVSPHNGLLLPPNYDYLFDRHLISFNHDGDILIQASEEMNLLLDAMGVDRKARLVSVSPDTNRFLAIHRRQFECLYRRFSISS